MNNKRLALIIVGIIAVAGVANFMLTGAIFPEDLLAYITSSSRPGNFNLTTATQSCVNNVPQVSLSWTVSNKANSYSIERQYPWTTTSWEVTGETAATSFTDATWEAGYDVGVFSYRVQAFGSRGTRYSNIKKISIVSCSGVVLPPVVIPPVVPPVTPTSTPTSTPPIVTPTSTATSTPGTATSTTTSTPPVTSGLKWGAYIGGGSSAISSFESLVGKPINMYAVFIGWGNTNGPFPSEFGSTIRDKGKTLVIYWETTSGSTSLDQPGYNYDSIISGSWDSYMTSFATAAKNYGGPVILIPFHEMNGNWDPWDGTVNGNNSAKFITAWRRVRGLFTSATNVKFGWAVNNVSVPDTAANAIEAYYPGSSYVDYVGVDGFNFANPWQNFGQVFNSSLTKLKAYNKPIYIFSMASAAGTQKAAWITDAFTVQIPAHPEIAGWIWFNVNKEQNWLVNSDAASLTAFKAGLPK